MVKNLLKTALLLFVIWVWLPTGVSDLVFIPYIIAQIGFNAYLIVSIFMVVYLYHSINGNSIKNKFQNLKKELR